MKSTIVALAVILPPLRNDQNVMVTPYFVGFDSQLKIKVRAIVYLQMHIRRCLLQLTSLGYVASLLTAKLDD